MTRRNFQNLLTAGALAGWTNIEVTSRNLPVIKPARLNPGDKVGLIAPGSPIPRKRIEQAQQTVLALGYQPVLGKFVFEKHGYLAGTDQQRLEDFHAMFENPAIKAIWCIRGGYGCTRLLPMIDYDLVKNNPKILIGYSDITALHLAIHRSTGLVTFHGPVASSKPTSYTLDGLKRALLANGSTDIYSFSGSHSPYPRPYTISKGSSTGILMGGNLSLLAALAGTEWSPSYQDKLVFLEDIGEKPYRIDRMLVQLFQATDLSRAAGIVLGVFLDCEADKDENSLTLAETLDDHFRPLEIPSCYGFTFGHIDDQCTLPVGIEATFDAEDKRITLLESATI